MKKNKKRMYYISETEYIYFPLIVRLVRSKTYLYSIINTNKNQLVKCIFGSKWVILWRKRLKCL